MIAQTIHDVDSKAPNPEAKEFVKKIGATYMASVTSSIAKQMNLPKNAFSKYMTQEIRDACDIIAQEANSNLDVLDSKVEGMKEQHQSYKRERNEWEDRHGNRE